MGVEPQLGNHRHGAQTQRVGIGNLVAAEPVGVDQLQDTNLFLLVLETGSGRATGRRRRSGPTGQHAHGFAHRGVTHLLGRSADARQVGMAETGQQLGFLLELLHDIKAKTAAGLTPSGRGRTSSSKG